MAPAGLGVFETTLPGGHGDDYRFVLDGTAWPDPSSRWQPDGIRGPSRVVDPARFGLGGERPALDPATQVIYELHVGTFTPEGTFTAVIPRLPELAELGVTAIELMPVGEFPGAAAGATTACTRAPRSRTTADPRVWPAWSTPPTAPASACCSTSSTTTSARPARRPTTPSAPTSPRSTRPLGADRRTSTTPGPARCASGCSRAPSTGSATCTSTACGSTRSTPSSIPGPGTSWPSSPTGCGPSTPARC